MKNLDLNHNEIRCSVSIASNISAGTGKTPDKHFVMYLNDSLGSAFELEKQLIVSKNLNFIALDRFGLLAEKVKKHGKKISNFIDKLDD